MAASVTMGVAAGVGSVVSVRNASSLSSSSSFGSPLVNAVAPLRPAARRNLMVTRASLPEEQSGRTARREMLASLMAAGAAIAAAGKSFAASGPGIPGGQRTAEKAGDLLKDADKLITEDSPARFGPGRVGGDDSGRIAQQGGAGAVESLQGAGRESIEGAKAAVTKAKSRIDGIFGKKTGDVSDASAVLDDVTGKVSSDVDTTQSKVKSDVSGTKEKAGSFVADAQSNFDSTSKDGKDIISGFVDKIQNAIPQ